MPRFFKDLKMEKFQTQWSLDMGNGQQKKQGSNGGVSHPSQASPHRLRLLECSSNMLIILEEQERQTSKSREDKPSRIPGVTSQAMERYTGKNSRRADEGLPPSLDKESSGV